MIFNEHSELIGQHALFSPSQSAWLRYNKQKIEDKILSMYRAPLGTEIHDFAAMQIEDRKKQTSVRGMKDNFVTFLRSKQRAFLMMGEGGYSKEYCDKLLTVFDYVTPETIETIKTYINDGVGFKMEPEQVLYYSDDIFGTADTIAFRNEFLRIHDLKTGVNPAHMEQLEVYAALFCLEYKKDPRSIGMELRLYQNGEVIVHNPDMDNMCALIDQIIHIGNMAKEVREGEQK